MITWHTMEDTPTNAEAQYLVIRQIFNHKMYDVVKYSSNPYQLSKYDFNEDTEPGFYSYDGEWGYYMVDDVLLWYELPEIPECLEV